MRKIIIFLVSILIFTTLFYTNNVKADLTENTIDNWDSSGSDYNVGSTSGIGEYGTFEIIDSVDVLTNAIIEDYAISSPNGVGMYTDTSLSCIGYIYYNFTDTSFNMNKISVAFKVLNMHATGSSESVGVMVEVYNVTDIQILQFFAYENPTDGGKDYIYAKDVFGALQSDTENAGWYADNGVYWLNATYLSGNTFNYSVERDTGVKMYKETTCYNGGNSDDYGHQISRIVITVYSANGGSGDFVIDDIYMIADLTGGGGNGYTQEFCNGIPQYFLTDPDLIGQRYLESRYTDWTGLGITGNITEVRFPISIDQYNNVASDPSNYKLRVNGYYFGMGDTMSAWDDYYDCYWVTWNNYTLPVIDDFPVFSFGCNISGLLDYYWYSVPIWACNIYPFKYHNNTLMSNNAIFDGTEYYDESCDYDLGYCFTVDNFNYGGNEPPTTPDEFINTTLYFNFYDGKTGTKLQMIDLAHALNYAELPYFPYEESFVEISLTLTAISEGGNETHNYMPIPQLPPYLYSYRSNQVTIYDDVVIASYSNNTIDFMGSSMGNIAGKVNGENVLWYRYTKLQEIQPFGTYDIYLIRYGEENYTEPIPNPVPWEEKYGEFFIEFYDENPQQTVECYYRIDGKQPILIYQVNDTLFGNYTNGYLWEMTDSEGSVLSTGQIIFNSGEKNGFIPVPYVFNKEGWYQIHLYNMTVGSIKQDEVYRGEDIYVCKEGVTPPSPETSWIPDWAKLIIAIIIILIVTISPLLLGIMISKGRELPQIPSLVYVAFFFLGLIACVLVNLISIIVPIIILLGLILGFAIMWLSGKQGE